VGRFFGLLAVCLIAALPSASRAADDYPNRPIKMIVPISAGSITDVASRLAAQALQAKLGQPVVVINKPGAAMVLGGSECAKSDPDGYTLCVVSPDTMSFNPLTIPDLPYNPDSFIPIIDMYHVVEGLMSPADAHINTIDDLRTKAVAESGKLNWGTLGERTTTDAFRQWLGEHWNTKFVAIPFKGGSEITAALLGNTIDGAKIGLGNMVSQLNDGKIKLLALSGSHRWQQFAGAPTFNEAGFGAYPAGPIYWGVVVPAGTPAPIVTRLHDALLGIFQGEKFKEFANQNFLETTAGSTADFVALLKKDRESAKVLVDKYMR
jgi:tripartite-type tricarboxylate transporter receptor subunit TctC